MTLMSQHHLCGDFFINAFYCYSHFYLLLFNIFAYHELYFILYYMDLESEIVIVVVVVVVAVYTSFLLIFLFMYYQFYVSSLISLLDGKYIWNKIYV